ncbi:PAS domain-containing protein [Paraburkholderia strydomiana]|uniref:PAS domain-containing protein n=1 Tax=Paraburkholderia strydomiana TaxID=1245417 RepID=UPI001BE6080C|nr:PAS domain-containing protein [Paraburkholderia strydomiana]MBT2795281.1 PAS domain-containing protein [Paraburkholderia strydomiana]
MPDLDFGRLFDASPNPYLVLDRRLHIAGANRAYLDSVKRKLRDIIGRWVWDAFPADEQTAGRFLASLEGVFRTKRPDTLSLVRFDVARPEMEGGGPIERYWSIVHSPVVDADGEVAFVLQHAIDVTNLQHLQAARLPENREDAPERIPAQSGIFERARETCENSIAARDESDPLNEMFSQAPGFVAMLRGPEHRFELVNPSYMRLVGHRPVVGLTVSEALPEAAAQGYLDILDQVFASGEPYVARGARSSLQMEPDHAASDRFVDFVYQPLKDATGRVTGIFIQGIDVTDLKAGEAALRASEARNRQILDSATDHAIITSELDGRITRWNEGARQILGWNEEEMLGEGAERFFTPEDVAAGRVAIEMRTAIEEGRSKDERWHQRKSGERFWAAGEMTLLRDEAQSATGFVKMLHDRTEQHQAQNAEKAAVRDLTTERARVVVQNLDRRRAKCVQPRRVMPRARHSRLQTEFGL